MHRTRHNAGGIRKLWRPELSLYRQHLLRLDPQSRRMRFGMPVDDRFIDAYVARVPRLQGVTYGYVEDGVVRAAAELRPFGLPLPGEAEAAVSVERNRQDCGIGTALLGRVVRAARNRGIARLHMTCLAANRKMQRVARKYGAVLQFDRGDVVGDLAPVAPSYFSLWREAAEDERGFVMAALDLSRRMLPAV